PQADEIQNELYSLYKILEPVKELDLAELAVEAKIAELEKPLVEVDKTFYNDFAHYLPFISVDLDDDFITPADKQDKKLWKLFIKVQKDKLYGKKYDELTTPDFYIDYIYQIFKQNEPKVLSDPGASLLYYKMGYCKSGKSKFYKLLLRDNRGNTREHRLINMFDFVESYLPNKLGGKENCDKYLAKLFANLKGGNKGEEALCDMPKGYLGINVFSCNAEFYTIKDGYTSSCESYGRDVKIEKIAKTKTQKSMREKQELESSIAELCKIRENINNAIAKYMKDVDLYINDNITIVPFNYARQWRCVTYFLHLLVNKRGRDIYEVINQYEIDMKHKELTSALGDIHTEIRNQTNVLGSKLDTINRSIIEMTDAITFAIHSQTKTLGAKLDSINYSVISTGASVVGAIKQLGATMGDAMSNMKFSVSVS
ncbi:MAG: hypothetical protein K2M36_02615, partial [Clostridia bacterium]|nr:hypothetical protein [Clostridia bacterium]